MRQRANHNRSHVHDSAMLSLTTRAAWMLLGIVCCFAPTAHAASLLALTSFGGTNIAPARLGPIGTSRPATSSYADFYTLPPPVGLVGISYSGSVASWVDFQRFRARAEAAGTFTAATGGNLGGGVTTTASGRMVDDGIVVTAAVPNVTNGILRIPVVVDGDVVLNYTLSNPTGPPPTMPPAFVLFTARCASGPNGTVLGSFNCGTFSRRFDDPANVGLDFFLDIPIQAGVPWQLWFEFQFEARLAYQGSGAGIFTGSVLGDFENTGTFGAARLFDATGTTEIPIVSITAASGVNYAVAADFNRLFGDGFE